MVFCNTICQQGCWTEVSNQITQYISDAIVICSIIILVQVRLEASLIIISIIETSCVY